MVAYAAERDLDPASMVTNTIEIEWPPRSGRTLTIPEIDEARWFGLDAARRHVLPSQAPLLDRLVAAADNPTSRGVGGRTDGDDDDQAER